VEDLFRGGIMSEPNDSNTPDSPAASKHSWKTWIHDEHHFKTTVTLMLAGLTFVTSLIVIFNVRASGRGAAATRDARLLGIRYLTGLGRSLWDLAVEKDLINNYQEVSGLIMMAQVYEKMAGADANAAFYKLMGEALAKSRARLLAQGEITKPAYFTPGYGAFNVLQFILDRVNVPATEIFERQEQKWAEGAFWSSRTDAYSAGLAIMAVAVFLLTLSLVLAAHIRFVMAGAGAALVTAVLAVSAVTTLHQWHGHTDESIRLLAKASGNAFAAQLYISWNGDTRSAAFLAQEARKDIDKILSVDPEYWTAVLLSARVHSVMGEAQFFAGAEDAGRGELDQSSSDLDRAIAGGKTEGYTYWSKGYVNFLLGRQETAAAAMNRALALLPDQKFTLGLVKAVALLYAGQIAEARGLAEESIEFALKKPLGMDTMNIRSIIKNLERFAEVRPAEGLPAMIVRLKEAAVCLAVLNRPRPADVKSTIPGLQFVAPVYDNMRRLVEAPPVSEYPAGTGRADFFLELKDMEKGQSIIRKTYLKAPGQVFWIEQPWLGRNETWDPASGHRLMLSVENRIPEAGEFLVSGDYRLEIYLDGNLKAIGRFKVL
jgi:tetratricopeptide (TPR) repeat protein